MSPGKRTRRLEPRRYRPSANYGQLERYNRTLKCKRSGVMWKDPEQMGRVPPADRVCATLLVQSIAALGIPNRLMLGRETSYTPYLTQRLGPGGGGGHSHIMSHRYVPLWRPPFSVFSSRSHDMRFYQTAPRFASDSLPRYTKNNAPMRTAPQSPLPGTARSLASVILPLRHSLFSLAAS